MKKIVKFLEIKPKLQQELLVESSYHGTNFEYYDSSLSVNGDLCLDNLDYFDRSNPNSIRGIFVDGDLLINGSLINSESEFGQILIVTGNIHTKNIIAGGSTIHIYGEAFLKYIFLSNYGHGDCYFNKLSCRLCIREGEHATGVNILNCGITFGGIYVASFEENEKIFEFNDLYYMRKNILGSKTIILNYFDYEELFYVFKDSKYYKNKFIDWDRVECLGEEDLIFIEGIIEEILDKKEKNLVEFVESTVNNSDFIEAIKKRASYRI